PPFPTRRSSDLAPTCQDRHPGRRCWKMCVFPAGSLRGRVLYHKRGYQATPPASSLSRAAVRGSSDLSGLRPSWTLCRVYSRALALRAALQALTALRLCRPGGRVTFFDAKKVTKETGLCQREVPLIGGLARTGTAADAHPRSSPCEASWLACLCQPTNQGALPMAVSQTQDQNRSPARQAPTAVPLSCRSLPCRRTVL